jgi:hypothetical protein
MSLGCQKIMIFLHITIIQQKNVKNAMFTLPVYRFITEIVQPADRELKSKCCAQKN